MTVHDPKCIGFMAAYRVCACDLIARVRADERNLTWLAALMEGYAKDAAHAEAVAARLVEVICSLDLQVRLLRRSNRSLMVDRDAARAEVAVLREREEVYIGNAYSAGMRAAHGDLRAKVMNLSSRVELNEVGHEVTWVRYADILALIDGPQ